MELELFSHHYSGRGGKKRFKEHVPYLLKAFVSEILSSEDIDIGFFIKGKRRGAVVSLDPFSDAQINITLDQNDIYALEIQCDDWNGNSKWLRQDLESNEIEAIPSRLKELMREVRDTKEVMNFNPRGLKN